MNALIETAIRGLASFIFLMLITVGVLMLKSTLKREQSFTDRDWKFLFGRPKEELFNGWLCKENDSRIPCLPDSRVGFIPGLSAVWACVVWPRGCRNSVSDCAGYAEGSWMTSHQCQSSGV